MANKINEKAKQKTEEILKVKTNQDFNAQKPNPNDPNQIKSIIKPENEKEIQKRIDSNDNVDNSVVIEDDYINKKNKKEFPNNYLANLLDKFKKHSIEQTIYQDHLFI